MSIHIAQCHNEECHIFCSVKTMWFKDGHLYCEVHKPEGSKPMKDTKIYTMEGDDE